MKADAHHKGPHPQSPDRVGITHEDQTQARYGDAQGGDLDLCHIQSHGSHHETQKPRQFPHGLYDPQLRRSDVENLLGEVVEHHAPHGEAEVEGEGAGGDGLEIDFSFFKNSHKFQNRPIYL